MSSLYLFQFAALVFMLVNALFVALARLNARWKNKRYERSRLMIFLALVLLSAQYYVQMRFHIRATVTTWEPWSTCSSILPVSD